MKHKALLKQSAEYVEQNLLSDCKLVMRMVTEEQEEARGDIFEALGSDPVGIVQTPDTNFQAHAWVLSQTLFLGCSPNDLMAVKDLATDKVRDWTMKAVHYEYLLKHAKLRGKRKEQMRCFYILSYTRLLTYGAIINIIGALLNGPPPEDDSEA